MWQDVNYLQSGVLKYVTKRTSENKYLFDYFRLHFLIHLMVLGSKSKRSTKRTSTVNKHEDFEWFVVIRLHRHKTVYRQFF